jgi:ribosome recycling factor
MMKRAKLPQDDEKRAEKEIQKLHDEAVKKITSLVAAKEKSIMSGK